MLNKDNKDGEYKTIEIVKTPDLPKYDYQRPEYGFGSIGGKQNQEPTKEPKVKSKGRLKMT